ncbi:hypothetical protein CRG98_021513 [Punica granatum]|uniref:Retrotransposon gag domain-containing protein n=1 Tax=Punica granatum TaxID=22663 RepID=A0A2I0JRH0_PUNGR|nr:hypothetical protein CRG98_021513 [Punica granatum]
MHTELQTIREERDQLLRELVATRAELTDHRELQRELAQALVHKKSMNREIARLSATLDQVWAETRKNTPPTPVHSQPPTMHVPPPLTPAGVPLAHHGAPSTHLTPPTSLGTPPAYSGAPLPQVLPLAVQAPSTSDDHMHIAALEGKAPPTFVPESGDAPASTTMHVSAAYLVRNLPAPPAFPQPSNVPAVTPFPPVATSKPPMVVPPPVSAPAVAPISTVLPPMIFLSTTAHAPAHTTEPFPSQALQPHIGFSYQAPPPINITFPELGMPTHTVPIALPTNFLPETETEYERRMKKMEETIRVLQASDPRHRTSYLDSTIFSGIQLPLKMLQPWGYEQFVIATFQDSLSRPALNWFMSLRAEDIPSLAELFKKFVEQYQYNIEMPSSFIELSTMEMTEDQKFEQYATSWLSEAAKHFSPICEAQQIQMFHGTLKGAYDSYLMGHKSSFSEMIMAGKQVDLGIKLRRLEGSTKKGEGESSRRTTAAAAPTSGRRGKDISVNAVNPGHQGSQQYVVNFHTCAACHSSIHSADRALSTSTSRSASLLFGCTGSTSTVGPATNRPSLHPYSSSNSTIQTLGFESSLTGAAGPSPARPTGQHDTIMTARTIRAPVGSTFPRIPITLQDLLAERLTPTGLFSRSHSLP